MREPSGASPGVADSGPTGQLIVNFGCKGGVGNTFSAINLAAALAQNHQVCLVDMDLQMGDVQVSMNMEGRCALSHLIKEVRKEGERLNPRTILDRHQATGISVVSQVHALEDLGMITPREVAATFSFLKRHFPFVVVDGLRGFDDNSMPILDLADTIMLVVNQEVPSVRSAARSMEVFRRIGYDAHKIAVVINRYHKREVVSIRDVAMAMKVKRIFTIRRDEKLALRSLNEGRPLLLMAPQSRIVQDLDLIAAGIPGKDCGKSGNGPKGSASAKGRKKAGAGKKGKDQDRAAKPVAVGAAGEAGAPPARRRRKKKKKKGFFSSLFTKKKK